MVAAVPTIVKISSLCSIISYGARDATYILQQRRNFRYGPYKALCYRVLFYCGVVNWCVEVPMNRIAHLPYGRDSGPVQSGRSLPVVGRIRHSEFVLRPGPYVDHPDVCSLDLARGCMHRCVFCAARAQGDHPGDESVYLFEGLAERLAVELAVRKTKPRAVLIGQPIDSPVCSYPKRG